MVDCSQYPVSRVCKIIFPSLMCYQEQFYKHKELLSQNRIIGWWRQVAEFRMQQEAEDAARSLVGVNFIETLPKIR